MPVEFDWYDQEKAIVLCRMSGKWTWDEMYAARAAHRERVSDLELERVDLLWMIEPNAPIPPSFVSVLKSAVGTASENWSITVVVQPTMFLKSLFNVVQKTYPEVGERYPFADSFEEGVEIIMRHRDEAKE